jgi:hypothetical protein
MVVYKKEENLHLSFSISRESCAISVVARRSQLASVVDSFGPKSGDNVKWDARSDVKLGIENISYKYAIMSGYFHIMFLCLKSSQQLTFRDDIYAVNSVQQEVL